MEREGSPDQVGNSSQSHHDQVAIKLRTVQDQVTIKSQSS